LACGFLYVPNPNGLSLSFSINLVYSCVLTCASNSTFARPAINNAYYRTF
jgi:hypothetical protein